MLLKIFSVRDQKTEIYNQPFYQKTHGEAERSFRQLVNDPKSTINAHPQDFDLYYLGDYDDNSGKMAPCDTPQHVIKAVDCITKEH